MTAPNKYIAYVDETGTNVLETSENGEPNIFICTTLLVKESDVEDISFALKEISQKMFSGAEIKSKNIGKNHKRRLKLLQEIKNFDFCYYSLIVNKDLIIRDSGLQFKKSFYKYINRMLYERIVKEFGSLHVVADSIGGKKYMASFDRYLKGKMPNLISRFSHNFENSAEVPLLQLADFISGTLGYCFIDTKKGAHSEQFRTILRPKELHVEAWPLLHPTVSTHVSCGQDDTLLESAKRRAIEFVDSNRFSQDVNCQMQAAVIQKLLFHQCFDCDHNGCLSASKLRTHLENLGFEKLTEPTFRSKVIGKVRDAGIVISGTSKGYRLAVSGQDIHDYLVHNKNIIEPMLSRLKRAQAVIKADIGTNNDILNTQDFFILKSLVKCYSETSLGLSTQRNQ